MIYITDVAINPQLMYMYTWTSRVLSQHLLLADADYRMKITWKVIGVKFQEYTSISLFSDENRRQTSSYAIPGCQQASLIDMHRKMSNIP